MPFIAIELVGPATRAQKAAIVADVTRSMVERLGKAADGVQVVINEHTPENYGAGGSLVADRTSAPPAQEVANANGGQ